MVVPATISGLSGVKLIERPELGLGAAMGARDSLLPGFPASSAVDSAVGTTGDSGATVVSRVGSVVAARVGSTVGSVPSAGPTVGSVITDASGVPASCISITAGSGADGDARASAVIRGVKRLNRIEMSPAHRTSAGPRFILMLSPCIF